METFCISFSSSYSGDELHLFNITVQNSMLTAAGSYYLVNNSLNTQKGEEKRKHFFAHMSARSNNGEVSIVYFVSTCHVDRVGVCWGGGNQDAQVLSVW